MGNLQQRRQILLHRRRRRAPRLAGPRRLRSQADRLQRKQLDKDWDDITLMGSKGNSKEFFLGNKLKVKVILQRVLKSL